MPLPLISDCIKQLSNTRWAVQCWGLLHSLQWQSSNRSAWNLYMQIKNQLYPRTRTFADALYLLIPIGSVPLVISSWITLAALSAFFNCEQWKFGWECFFFHAGCNVFKAAFPLHRISVTQWFIYRHLNRTIHGTVCVLHAFFVFSTWTQCSREFGFKTNNDLC